MSLNSFLQTHPYKRVDSLKHICTALKISTNGVAETLRSRIIEKVGENDEMEKQVKDVALEFKNQNNARKSSTSVVGDPTTPKYPSTPTVHILKGSSPLRERISGGLNATINLFDTQSDTQVGEKSILDQIDQLKEMEDSMFNDSGKELPCTERRSENEAQKTQFDFDNTMWYDDSTKENFHMDLKKLGFLVGKAVEIVAAKDHQIEMILGEVKTLVNTTTVILNKHDQDIKDLKQSIKEEIEDIRKEIKGPAEENSEKLTIALDRLEQAETKIMQETDTIKTVLNKIQGQTIPPQTNQPKKPAKETSDIQEKLQNIAQSSNPGKAPEKEKVLIIADSNGEHLIPNMLHDEKEVLIEKRYSLDQAMKDLPRLGMPEKVCDVVMLTAVNNIKLPNANIQETVGKVDNACRIYSDAFPNAKIHIGSVAPTNEKHIQFNAHLENLASTRGAQFISTAPMFDRKTGNVRPNMMNGIHYSKIGVKVLAKEIKRSLYKRSHTKNKEAHNFSPNMQERNVMHPPATQTQEMTRFLKMALQCLGNNA